VLRIDSGTASARARASDAQSCSFGYLCFSGFCLVSAAELQRLLLDLYLGFSIPILAPRFCLPNCLVGLLFSR